MKAILLPIDRPTVNNRIYTKECVEKMLAEYQPIIDKQRSLGYVDTDGLGFTKDLTKSAVLVTKLEVEEGNLVATYDVLKTPMGNQVNDLLSIGCEFTSVCEVNVSDIVNGVIKNAKFLSINLVKE